LDVYKDYETVNFSTWIVERATPSHLL